MPLLQIYSGVCQWKKFKLKITRWRCSQQLRLWNQYERFEIFLNSTFGRNMKYCDQHVSECLSICPLAYLKHAQISPDFSVHATCSAVALSSSINSVIRCILPVLWMTSDVWLSMFSKQQLLTVCVWKMPASFFHACS